MIWIGPFHRRHGNFYSKSDDRDFERGDALVIDRSALNSENAF